MFVSEVCVVPPFVVKETGAVRYADMYMDENDVIA